MQINGYSNVMSSYKLKTQNRGNNIFSSVIAKNATATTESKKLTKAEEMEIFKKEIHKEISDIYGTASSALLSNSVHITDGAFERMKSDPKFKNKMMNILREDASATHQMPYGVHVTTTIDENGYSAYGANVYKSDSKEDKDDKKADADKKAEGAFYHKSSSKSDLSPNRIYLDKIWLQKKHKQEVLEQIQQERRLLRRSQARNVLVDNARLDDYMQEINYINSYTSYI